MQAFLSEKALEEAVLDLFRRLGWATARGPELSGERASKDVVLVGRLRAALARLNPGLPPAAVESAVAALLRPEGGSLLEENQRFHRFVTEGIPVEVESAGQRSTRSLRLFDPDDLDANDWLAVQQLTVSEPATGRPHPDRRPDMVAFINGLPLGLLELKNPADRQATTQKAFRQLQTYRQAMPDLFAFNELLAVTDGLDARLGTLSSDWERFAPWNTIDGGDLPPGVPAYESLLRGVFDKARLLDIVRRFVLFEAERDRTVKKVAGYHQYHAVLKAEASVVQAVRAGHKAGVVWHTQGAGKSLTMAFLAARLAQNPELRNPTLLVLTDRRDLDDQLFGTFCGCAEFLRQTPQQAEDRDGMRKLLAVPSGGIVFSTIQKFDLLEGEARHPALTLRENVVVIADEAHRSQYGFAADVKDDGSLRLGFAQHLRDALPQATFLGFTGTPIDTADKVTVNVFGPVLDAYDIEKAVRDGATVPIHYESRLARLGLDEALKGPLDEEFDRLTEGETPQTRRKLSGKWSALEAIVSAPARVKRVAADLVGHFEERCASVPGKGMAVCISRGAAVALFDEIIKLRPHWHDPDDAAGAVKVVMSGAASDETAFQPHLRSGAALRAMAARFKKPGDPLRLVIVCDMWLTGFDAPCAHTMYLDKPLRAHGLMQAIARVNRVHGSKPNGLVVDYLGLGHELREAVRSYSASGGRGDVTLDMEKAVETLREKRDIVRGVLHGCPYTDALDGTPAERLAALRRVCDFLKAGRAGLIDRFVKAATELHKAFMVAAATEAGRDAAVEVGFALAARAAFGKEIPGGPRPQADLDAALRQLLSRAIVSEGVVDVFAVAGLPRPEVSVLDERFLADVAAMPQRNLAAELLERLLRGAIQAGSRGNTVRSEKFSDLLDKALLRYENRSIEAAQLVEEMLAMARQFREAAGRGEELKLTEDEVAFYDALAAEASIEAVMSRPVLCDLARELVQRVRASVTIDWTEKESARADLRVMIKRLLKKHKYPPDKQEAAVETVLRQAEGLCADWATEGKL